MGMELVTLNPQLALRYHLPETMRGALIVNIDPESPLSQAAHLNDVIAKINDQSIQTAEDVARLMTERNEHDQLVLSLDRPARNGIECYTFRVP